MTLPDLDSVMTTAEAAKLLSVSQIHVTDLCRQGKLTGTKISGAWWVDKASLAEYRKLQAFSPARRSKTRGRK